MRILITGAFGFVGRNLSAYLVARGHHLIALDVAKQELVAYAEYVSWPELDRIEWGTVDAVIHLAGKAHDTKNASDPQSYFDVNVGLTKKIVDAWMSGNSHRGTESTEYGDGHPHIIGDVSRKGAKTQRDSLASMAEGQSGGAVSVPAKLATPANLLSLPKRFILFSSVKAVADRVEGVLTEDAVPEPKTPYGMSKLEAEKVVRSSFVRECGSASVRRTEGGRRTTEDGERSSLVHDCESALVGESEDGGRRTDSRSGSTNERMNSRTTELLFYILRPCMIHGPGNKGNLNLLYGIVRKGIPWPLGAFENRRSFASIGNVCEVVEGLLSGEVESGVYQVADDEALSTNELVGLMSDVMGRRALVWAIPAGLIRATARLGDSLHLPLNSERLKKLTESYVVSNEKIKRALGWEKMPVSASDGMRKTLESYGKISLTEAQRSQSLD